MSNKIISSPESCCQRDVAYIDFSKTSDSTDIDILLKKLINKDFHTNPIQLIFSHLRNPMLYVKFNIVICNKFLIHLYPQGSNLEPYDFYGIYKSHMVPDRCSKLMFYDFCLRMI